MRLRSAFSRRKKLANHKFQIEALIFLFRRIIYIDIHLIWLCKSLQESKATAIREDKSTPCVSSRLGVPSGRSRETFWQLAV